MAVDIGAMSNFPAGFAHGLSIRGMPLLQMQQGSVYFVGNGTVLNRNAKAGSDGNRGTYLDPFGTINYAPGETGAPVLDGVIAYVECKVHTVHPGGDHWIVVGDAVGGGFHGGAPLGYFRGAYSHLS